MPHLKPKDVLERAKEFLNCAELALQKDYFNGCAICSYAALFWAARAALAYEGFDRPTWEHSDLRSKFTEELVKRRSRYPGNYGTWLSNAYRLRNFAQYHFDSPQIKKIRRMANHAKEFIHRIEEVIENEDETIHLKKTSAAASQRIG